MIDKNKLYVSPHENPDWDNLWIRIDTNPEIGRGFRSLSLSKNDLVWLRELLIAATPIVLLERRNEMGEQIVHVDIKNRYIIIEEFPDDRGALVADTLRPGTTGSSEEFVVVYLTANRLAELRKTGDIPKKNKRRKND